jgi:hypothetical protein
VAPSPGGCLRTSQTTTEPSRVPTSARSHRPQPTASHRRQVNGVPADDLGAANGGCAVVTETRNVDLATFIGETVTIEFLFDSTDHLNNETLGWQVDNFVVSFVGLDTCPADTDHSGVVDVNDLNNVILDWGTDGAASGGDITAATPGSPPDGIVNVNDLNAVIVGWGACP